MLITKKVIRELQSITPTSLWGLLGGLLLGLGVAVSYTTASAPVIAGIIGACSGAGAIFGHTMGELLGDKFDMRGDSPGGVFHEPSAELTDHIQLRAQALQQSFLAQPTREHHVANTAALLAMRHRPADAAQTSFRERAVASLPAALRR